MTIARSIYLDHNATSPILPEVSEAVTRALVDCVGNPSSVHAAGRESKRRVERAREQVAELIHAPDASQIVFTASGTEADNLAVMGLAESDGGREGVVTTAVEHPAVLEPCRELKRRGRELTVVPVDEEGIVDRGAVLEALGARPSLLSVMYVNNETGAVQPVAELGKLAFDAGVRFHVDAVQAVGKLDVDVTRLPITTLALSGHKIGGPKGVGALFVREGTSLRPLLLGGGQERGRRPGTENVAGVVGLGVAAALARVRWSGMAAELGRLSSDFLQGLLARVPWAVLNSPTDHRLRVPGTLNLSFPGVDANRLVLELDRSGICVSSGSACSSGSAKPSYVLLAQGRSSAVARSALRISLGHGNDASQLEHVVQAIGSALDRMGAGPSVDKPSRTERAHP